MRYVDTSYRQCDDALGSWLAEVLSGASPVVAVRVQTGYFAVEAMGHFESTLHALTLADRTTRFLVGSNDGQTERSAVTNLLKLLGPPRPQLRVGVVTFQAGLFHPKVFHFERADGSSTAYVGSANLTTPGVTGQNIEAGVILDTREDDSSSVLAAIADAVDEWFDKQRPALYQVRVDSDLDRLVVAGVLGVPASPRRQRLVLSAKGAGQPPRPGHSLRRLVPLPPIKRPLSVKPSVVPPPRQPSLRVPPGRVGMSAPHSAAMPTTVKRWYKLLHRSDVGRLGRGSNAQGAMTLVRGPGIRGRSRHPIDQETYFRNDFFADAPWLRLPIGNREVARVSMEVIAHGESLGRHELQLRYRAGLSALQRNRTTLLHWGPEMSTYLRYQRNHAGDVATIEKLSDGTYRLVLDGTETGPFLA